MNAVDARNTRTRTLQERILQLSPKLPRDPDGLYRELRTVLRAASDEGVLTTKPHEIFALLKTSTDALPATHTAILGGEKNFKRIKGKAHFARKDGAWFDFAITVSCRPNEPLELIGYNFEIRFAEGTPEFIRFDLNPPDHANNEIGMRSHLHPGSADISVPSPFMSPLEILDLFLYSLHLPEGRKAPRSVLR